MTDITAEELAKVNSFPRLVDLLRDKLEWPIPADYGLEDVVFEYEPRELGLKDEDAAKLREIHQLRPLVTNQPWGIFFLSFEDKTMSVTVLRRILRALVVSKRGESKGEERAAWDKRDLIFAANFGKSGERELAFVHFNDGAGTGDLPVMKVLGWNARDTVLHNRYAANMLTKQLAWPDDPSDQSAWRNQWASAFSVGHREVITTAQELAKRLAALAGDIRARANQLLAAETDKGPMRTMLEAFRKNLIHDLNDDGFADMFAQTICYGMLAARISRPVGIIADNLADMVPKTNPFLKELFANFLKIGGRDKRRGMDFDELGVRDVVDMLNRANMEAVLRDFGDRNPKEDPVIHFYELFLKEYDPQKRMQRGVFYTPRPVVNFIVRGVDEILRTEFDLPLGLADTTTWGELAARNDKITIPDHVRPDAPFVQILDPATGTGTFLVEVIDLIHKRMVEHWHGEGKSKVEIAEAWNAYVPAHLLPRLTAFELMMAPYAIAHMKVGLKLTETGYGFGSDERARVFLTNALEPAHDLDMQFDFMSQALAHEAKAANAAKEEVRYTAIIGNPPYSGISVNQGEWIKNLLKGKASDRFKKANYYAVKGETLTEKKIWIQDDYVKFFRLTHSFIETSAFGVIGLITNNSYLDGPTFRGMRSALLDTFQRLTVLNLHGSGKRKLSETADENVFDIMQGVAVFIGTKSGAQESKTQSIDLFGKRDFKFEWLIAAGLEGQDIEPSAPWYWFVYRSGENSEYEDFHSLRDVFQVFSTSVQTSRDELTVDFTPNELLAKIARYQPSLSRFFRFKGSEGARRAAKQAIASSTKVQQNIRSYQYRVFDRRSIAYLDEIIHRPRREVMRNFEIPNVALLVPRQLAGNEFSHLFCTSVVADMCVVSGATKEAVQCFPLWLLPSAAEDFPRPNIRQKLSDQACRQMQMAYSDGIPRGTQQSMGAEYRHKKAAQIGLLDQAWDGRGDLEKDFGPRDLFDWIYAILHAPSYRIRYAEFLKSDFPRIPTPGSRALFADLVPLGRDLVTLHLLKPDDATVLKTPEIRFCGHGEARVGKGYPEYENGKVKINASRWFEDVPQATYEFHVGGYQPCEKWLKDRAAKGGKNPSEGRILTDDDILHYRRMVTALTETRRIMIKIDKVIETHGGWPGAFAIGSEAGEGA